MFAARLRRAAPALGGGLRRSPVARKCAMSPTSQGRPSAARPIMTASAPDMLEHLARVVFGAAQSPLATTGMRTAAFTAAIAAPIGRGRVELLARAAMHGDHRGAFGLRRGAQASAALRDASSQPSRILTLTGTRIASRAAAISRAARSRSRISAAPARPPVTRLHGQPMLMSIQCAPEASALRAAASAISCRIARGDLNDARSAAGAFQPQPRLAIAARDARGRHHLADGRRGAETLAIRRMVGSVTPAIGARSARPANVIAPMLKGEGSKLDA